MKKGFENPDNRVVLVGTEEIINRVKRVFSESFYGPSGSDYHVHEEIAQGKK